jgi:hypothetical protein
MRFGGRFESWGSRQLTLVLLGVAVLGAAVLLITLDSHLTFIADDWGLLLRRQAWTADTFLDPYAEHLILGPLLIFKPLQELVGMDSSLPYYLFSIALYLGAAVLLFFYLRPRVGDWLALFGAVLVLFLGAAFEDLLWISPLNFSGSIVAGLGMLLACDREDVRGDRIACALLVVSLAFSSVGIAFAAGAAAEVALGRHPRLRRLYLVALPVAVYGFWWIAFKQGGEGHVSADNFEQLPRFLFDVIAAGFASLLGISDEAGGPGEAPLIARVLAVAAAIGVVYRIVGERRVSRGLGVALTIAIVFWALIGIDRAPGRYANSSRYQLMSAVFLLLILAELLRGVRVGRPLLVGAAAITVFAAANGISLLKQEYDGSWRPFAESTRATLGAVELAGDRADPGFQVSFPPTLRVGARTYLDTVRRFGSPADDEAQLIAASPADRAEADLTLAQALGLALVEPQPGLRTVGCQPLKASGSGETGVTLLHGGFTLANRGNAAVEVMLSRFADEPSVDLGPLPAGVTTSLTIPVDGSPRPWNLALEGSGPLRLCTTEPTAESTRP